MVVIYVKLAHIYYLGMFYLIKNVPFNFLDKSRVKKIEAYWEKLKAFWLFGVNVYHQTVSFCIWPIQIIIIYFLVKIYRTCHFSEFLSSKEWKTTYQCKSNWSNFDSRPKSIEKRLTVNQFGQIGISAKSKFILRNHFFRNSIFYQLDHCKNTLFY